MRRSLITLVVAALVVGGCGFKLRQAAALPKAMDVTFVDVSDPRGKFRRELRTALQSNGVNIVGSKQDGASVLSIPYQRLSRQVLSVGARARAREFELVYRVRFSLRDANGEELIPEQNLELRRDYTFDEQQVLGTTSEEEILRGDLRRDMVRQILLRLESFGDTAQ